MGIACQWLAWLARLPAILLLLLCGIIIGPVTGLLNPDDLFADLLFPMVSLSVAVILFEGSLTLKIDEIRGLASVVRNLITVGPQGTFTLEQSSERPVVLISGGVGLTPLLSMLHALAEDGTRRPVWFIHGARDGDHHPLRREVERLAESAPNVRLHVTYSRPGPNDVVGRRNYSAGRVDGALITKLVPGLDADFYLCGPIYFMAAIQAQLEARGVPMERIRTESFGPTA